MKNEKISILIIFILILIIPEVIGAGIIIRNGSCQVGETFLFSVFQPNDTHISSSQDFFNYSVCYPKNRTINLRNGSCLSGENIILSLYEPNNTHVSAVDGYFNYSLCSPDIDCVYQATCFTGISIGSLYQQNDSHWASSTYFDNILCCEEPPEIWSVEGGGPGYSTVPPEEEQDVRISEIEIQKIIDKIKEIGIEFILIFFVLFIIFIFVRKERCYYCRKKFKRKDLVLYKKKTSCKKCYQTQKAKE